MSSPIVLELGSHSLKVHYQSRSSGIFRKSRFPWELGHEVYATGRVSKRTAAKAIETLTELRRKGIHPQSVLAIATGALRDAENCRQFLRLLESKLNLVVRVISGREEASLLAQGYLASSDALPAMITDIGGGSLEIVYLGEDKTILRDSLPLGAIRIAHFGRRDDGGFDEALVESWIADSFQEASVITADEIHCTGGTAKAISKILSRPTVTLEALVGLEKTIRSSGPPPGLKADRAKVLLPGTMVLRKLMEHANAKTLTYLKVPVGRIFLQKYVQRIPSRGDPERKQYLLRDLRITQIYAPKSEAGVHSDHEGDDEETHLI